MEKPARSKLPTLCVSWPIHQSRVTSHLPGMLLVFELEGHSHLQALRNALPGLWIVFSSDVQRPAPNGRNSCRAFPPSILGSTTSPSGVDKERHIDPAFDAAHLRLTRILRRYVV